MAKYSRKPFKKYTHRFKVEFVLNDNCKSTTNMDIYSDSGSYDDLEKHISRNKSEKVLSFNIFHRASKEQDDAVSKMLDEFLKD